LNLRPSGYEPDELPDCSTPRGSEDRDQRTDPDGGLSPIDREAGRDRGRRTAGATDGWAGAKRQRAPRSDGGARWHRARCSDLGRLPRSSDLWTPGSTWRRPALPPLLGQYPGRGGVSRPSSEWGRVGPPRCDHQVEAGVQRSEDRGGWSAGAQWPARCPACMVAQAGGPGPGPGVVKLGAWGSQRAGGGGAAISRAGARCRAPASSDLCHLPSVI
jgi:hypothetical protein